MHSFKIYHREEGRQPKLQYNTLQIKKPNKTIFDILRKN